MSQIHMLLIYPDFLEDTKNNRSVPGNYSEGLASISAVLKAAGHAVSLYHMTYMPDKEEFIAKVRSFGASLAGFSVRTTAVPFLREFAAWMKAELPGLPITCGGYHPTLAPAEVLAVDGVDSVVIGEGEYAMRDMCDALREGLVRTDIESVWYKNADGSFLKNPVRPMVEDLDELPFPDLDLFDYKNLRTGRINTAMAMVSRGCLFSCTYCGNSQFRNVYPNRKKYARFRSPQKALEVLQRILIKDPDVKFIEFRDAIFNTYEDWFYEFMPLYKEHIGLPFNCNLRFDMLDEKMVKTLAECGCYMIDIGLESGDPEMRTKYLHRNMQDEHMVKVARWLKENRITTCTYNIVGLPHETLALALKTVKLNARLDVDRVIANIFYPYPMTKLEEFAREAGFIDPSVDPNDAVQLRMPNFSRDDILYVHHRFHLLMRKYRRLYALPPEQAERKVAALDKRILSSLRPRALIWRWEDMKDKSIRNLKRAVSKYAPKVYLALRNRKIRALKKK